ncbi:MAG: CARDB domain-containing protein [Candidatus Methanofastidiosia archaeon]
MKKLFPVVVIIMLLTTIPVTSQEGKAELIVTSSAIVFSNEKPYEGDAVFISLTVKNVGEVAASDVEIAVFDGDPTSSGMRIGPEEIIIEKINWSGFATISFKWDAKEVGIHQIYVVADPKNKIQEFDKMNNSAFREVEVRTKIDYLTLDYYPSLFFESSIVVTGDVIPHGIHNASSGLSDFEAGEAIRAEIYNLGGFAFEARDVVVCYCQNNQVLISREFLYNNLISVGGPYPNLLASRYMQDAKEESENLLPVEFVNINGAYSIVTSEGDVIVDDNTPDKAFYGIIAIYQDDCRVSLVVAGMHSEGTLACALVLSDHPLYSEMLAGKRAVVVKGVDNDNDGYADSVEVVWSA